MTDNHESKIQPPRPFKVVTPPPKTTAVPLPLKVIAVIAILAAVLMAGQWLIAGGAAVKADPDKQEASKAQVDAPGDATESKP